MKAGWPRLSVLALVTCTCVSAGEKARERKGGPLAQASDPWVASPSHDADASPAAAAAPACEDEASALAMSDASGGCPSSVDTVTFADLLADVIDLDRLACAPTPPYVSGLVSSHDRSSDGAPRGSEDWFANRDYVMIAADRTVTLLDQQGPGVITRIWSALPAGTLRIYLDGATEPAIEAPLRELLSGGVEPFVAPFAFVAAGGHNLYFPIPFAKRCRVTLTGEAPQTFFHISLRRYPAGTAVEPFGPEALAATECMRGLIAARLTKLRPDTDAAETGQWHAFMLDTREPDRAVMLTAGEEGGVLRELRLTPAGTDSLALRETVLAIAFDGDETVRVPLGDFFGVGLGLRKINSIPIGVDPHGVLTSRWPMPFEREARISLASTGAQGTEVKVEALLDAKPWSEQSLYFHAGWHAPETFSSPPFSDWNLATLTGTGLYVGNVLNFVNRVETWWGEGDEKIYVDGEPFPSHFGTGTEDYYGYAWCSNERFTQTYVGQPLSGERKDFGYTSLYRFHVLDPIPFHTSLRFDLEARHRGNPVDVTYDAVSFWYARPGSSMSNAANDPETFRVPELGVDEPQDVPIGRYTCGG